MDKMVRSDIEKAQGVSGFLVPLEVLPENVRLKGPGGYVGLNVYGIVRKIDSQMYLEVEKWKML